MDSLTTVFFVMYNAKILIEVTTMKLFKKIFRPINSARLKLKLWPVLLKADDTQLIIIRDMVSKQLALRTKKRRKDK